MNNNTLEKLKKAEKKINKEYIVHLGGMDVRVKVIACEFRYGRIDFKIAPVGGGTEKWVNESSLKPAPSVWTKKR